METQNQPVACQCSGILKGVTVGCAVLAMVLPWFGKVPGIIGILLAIAAIVCAIIALCKKSKVFGIIMIIVGLIAGGVATFGIMYSVAKDWGMLDQGEVQIEFEQKIRAAQNAGDLKKVEELRKEQQEAMEQYSRNLQERLVN